MKKKQNDALQNLVEQMIARTWRHVLTSSFLFLIFEPLLFNLYMLRLGQFLQDYGISYHSYADDTQTYRLTWPSLQTTMIPLTHLLSTSLTIGQNSLQLNRDKTEILFSGIAMRNSDWLSIWIREHWNPKK